MNQQTLFNTPQQQLTSDDYYTPAWIFDKLQITFDIDVAAPSTPLAWTIPATISYTEQDNGLTQPWHGTVWMNPPYSNPTPWVDRFLQHANGIALLPFTRARWFRDMWNICDTIMNLSEHNGKLFKFCTADQTPKGIFMPCALFGIGPQSHVLHNFSNRVR